MDHQTIELHFLNQLSDKNLSNGIAAIKTLLFVLEKTKFNTIQGLVNTIKDAIIVLKKCGKPITAVCSSCELFICFITLASPKLEDKTMEEVKEIMLARGHTFLKKLLDSRNVITKYATDFITDGCRILTHSRSRVVLETAKAAAAQNKHFHVYVTMSLDDEGEEMIEDLRALNIDCTLVLDSAIGYIMESIDFVFCGAEGVMESGGIINRIGTFTMALCAEKMNKPFYVLTESFKFSRLYPLYQRDLPDSYKYPKNTSRLDENFSKIHPLVDYTPPSLITLLFTDLGILTPSAVSDELIKLY